MAEISYVGLADSSKTGNEPSALRIKMVMSFLSKIDLPTSLVARALLALCVPTDGRRIAGAPLLQDTTIALNDLLSFGPIRAQYPPAQEAGFFIRREIDRLRRMRVDWCQDVASLPYGEASPHNGDEFLDIIEMTEWTSTGTGSARTTLSWKVRGGQWAYWSMNPLGRVSLCRLAGASLMLPDQVAVDLATDLLIALLLSINSDGPSRSSFYEIGWLLDRAGALAQPECRTMAWESEMRDRFGRAMQALLEAGVFAVLTLPPGRRSEVNGAVAGEWLRGQVTVTMARHSQSAGFGTESCQRLPSDHGIH